MKLIADSGSTKTDWILIKGGKRVHQLQTQGINPFYLNSSEIVKILKEELLPNLNNLHPETVFFYGAGCSFPEKQATIAAAFHNIWGKTIELTIDSDLVAAAHALCGKKEGIACILGTGSNSCHWDGKQIVKNVPPLGYILGDEGSGAVLGKLLVADLLKNQLPKQLVTKFYKQYDTTYEELMKEVYKLPYPNRNLAKYTYFLKKNLDQKPIYNLIKKSFDSFAERNLAQYPKGLPVHFVGSIAIAFEAVLRNTLLEKGYTIGTILKAPIEALEHYKD